MRIVQTTSWLAVTLLMSACSSVPETPRAPALPVPEQFVQTPDSEQQRSPWWQQALSSEWQADLEQVLQANPAILRAAADVQRARATLAQSDAARRLDVGASASAGLSRNDGNDSNTLSSALNATLPLDLFDRLKLSRDASAHQLAQRLAELEQARLDQIQAYLLAVVDAAEADRLGGLLKQQLKTAVTLLELTELRFSQGLASSVDVLQQREQQAALRQQQPAVALAMRQALNRMAELQGRAPSADQSIPPMPQASAKVAAATPHQLLDRRPDLIAARAALAASSSDYESLLRERLPDVELSAQALLRTVSGNPSALVDIALDATAPLFDSGRLSAQFQAGAADLQGAGVDYLQDWLSALRRTEDLIAAQQSGLAQLELSAERLRVNEQLFKAAERRYRRGVSDYLPVLAALRSLQQQERDHLALQAEQQRITIRLHSAMGLPRAMGDSE